MAAPRGAVARWHLDIIIQFLHRTLLARLRAPYALVSCPASPSLPLAWAALGSRSRSRCVQASVAFRHLLVSFGSLVCVRLKGRRHVS